MKKILVPTDFSDNATTAVMYAASIAVAQGSSICLVHIIEPVVDGIRQPYALQGKLENAITENRVRSLQEQEQLVREMYPGLSLLSETARGTVINAIIDKSMSDAFDLIVMGTTGASGLKELFMGSVATGIMSKSQIPVLMIPASANLATPTKILLATNRFEHHPSLLKPLVELAKTFNASIQVIVHLDPEDAGPVDYINNTRQLNHYISFLQHQFPEVSFNHELLEGEGFEESITGYCKAQGIGMIAMIPYPKSTFEKIFSKSLTKKMAFHTELPLLTLPSLLTTDPKEKHAFNAE